MLHIKAKYLREAAEKARAKLEKAGIVAPDGSGDKDVEYIFGALHRLYTGSLEIYDFEGVDE